MPQENNYNNQDFYGNPSNNKSEGPNNPFAQNPNPQQEVQPEISRSEFIPPLNPPTSSVNVSQSNRSTLDSLDLGKNNDLFAKYYNLFRQYPGKTLYLASLIGALLFTFLPWIGTLLTNNSYNYYYFIGRNIFCLLYLLGIILLFSIRMINWFKLSAFNPYMKIIDFIETTLIGALLMFILTIGIYGDVQFGLILSLICILGICIYISYLKIFKLNKL